MGHPYTDFFFMPLLGVGGGGGEEGSRISSVPAPLEVFAGPRPPQNPQKV